MADFVTTLVVLTGPPASLADFSAAHLKAGNFDFNTVHPMPPELEIESDSFVETGYAALYGDWTTEAGRWMYKEPAAAFGFPFPLESREQVLRCLESFDCADLYLVPARTYHDNVIKHGHGDWYGWRMEHWGTKWNADDVRMATSPGAIAFSFVTAGAFPKIVFKTLSQSYPDLAFHVRYFDEHFRWARDFVLVRGKETGKQKRPARDIAAEVDDFRCGAA